MTREQMMAYRKQLVDHLEQCRELVKPRERFFKKYHSRLFWSLQRDLNLRVRAENGLVVEFCSGCWPSWSCISCGGRCG